MKKWVGSIPLCCACGQKPQTWFVDGQSKHGPWGVFCEPCWRFHGAGALGLGRGQRYDAKSGNQLPAGASDDVPAHVARVM